MLLRYLHPLHVVVGAILLVVAAVPAILADPAVRSVVEHHPWVAVYLAAAAGVVRAIEKVHTQG